MCGVCEQEIAKSLWTCKSQSQSKVVYKIEQLQPTCVNESCRMKCPYMDCVSLCRHMYHCECADYANGHNANICTVYICGYCQTTSPLILMVRMYTSQPVYHRRYIISQIWSTMMTPLQYNQPSIQA